VEVFELGAGALQVSVVVEKVQTTKQRLGVAAHECHEVLGMEKTMPANESDDVVVAIRELQGGDVGEAFESG